MADAPASWAQWEFALADTSAFRAAMNPEVLAAVCFYATDIHKRGLGKGMTDDSLDRVKEIKGELLMIWGRQIRMCPAKAARLFTTRWLTAL